MSIYVEESKEEILENFELLYDKYLEEKLEVVTKSQEAENQYKKELVKKVSQTTVPDIVNGMASLQLNFNDSLDTLSKKLEDETVKLNNLNESIKIENVRLKEIKEITTVAEALNILSYEHTQTVTQIIDEHQDSKKALLDGIALAKKEWEEENTQFEDEKIESEKIKAKTREQESEEYDYEQTRQDQISKDKYEEKKSLLLRDIKENDTKKEKDWENREKVLLNEAENLEKYNKAIEEAPERLKTETTKAREKAISKINAEAKIEAELKEKENTANIEIYELEVSSLESTIQEQKEEIVELSEQLNKILEQVQTLASNAVSAK